MLIDEIIGQLMTEYPEAKEFLNELSTDNQGGRTFVLWDIMMQVHWDTVKLAGDPAPGRFVLGGLQRALIEHHSKVLKLARALDVGIIDLFPCTVGEHTVTLSQDEVDLLQEGDGNDIELVIKQILDQVKEKE